MGQSVFTEGESIVAIRNKSRSGIRTNGSSVRTREGNIARGPGRRMLKKGTRVRLRTSTYGNTLYEEVLGTIVYTYAPSVYENRLYEVEWDGEEATSLVERKDIDVTETTSE